MGIDILPILVKRVCSQSGSAVEKKYSKSKTDSYEQFYEKAASQLINECNNQLFLNGLLASSDSLYENLLKLLDEKRPKKINKKFRQTVEGVLDYYIRSSFKTTPFNSFTKIEINDLTSPFSYDNQFEGLYSNVNTELYGYFLKKIELDIINNTRLNLRINETLTLYHGAYLFWFNNLNIDNFQTLERSDVLDYILKKYNNKKFTVNSLINDLLLIVDASFVELQNYIIDLIRTGVILLSHNKSVISTSRDENFISILEENSNKTNLYTQLIKRIKILQEESNKLSLNDYESYKKIEGVWAELQTYFIQDENNKSFIDSSNNLGVKNNIRHFPFKKYKLIYSDYYEVSKTPYERGNLDSKILTIDSYLKSLVFFDSKSKHIDLIESMFLEFIKDSKSKEAKLLAFYKYYYEKLKSKKVDIEEKFTQWEDEEKVAIQKIENEIKSNPQTKSDEIVVSLSVIQRAMSNYRTSKIRHDKSAFSCYFMPISNNEWVLEGTGLGLGMTIGRFLNPEGFKKMSNKINQINASNYPDYLICDMTDESIFNGNIHPQFSDNEIIFNSQSYLFDNSNKIHISDILITMKNGKIMLLDSNSKKPILPIILSLQMLNQRSGLYQFLSLFSPQQVLGFRPILLSCSNFSKNIDGDVKIFPRIKIDNGIIIKRKRWLIHTTRLKIILNSPKEYILVEIKLFLEKLGCKNEFFIKSNEESSLKSVYCNLDNPLFYKQLKKIISKSDRVLITERLPSSENLSELDFSTPEEHIVSWYSTN